MNKKIILGSMLLMTSSFSYADSCDEAIRLMDNPLNVKRKRELAQIAVKHCSAVKNTKPHLTLAKMDLSEGKLSEAITWNEEAQKLNPNLVETYISICDIHNQLKAYEKTLSLCRKALSLKGGVSEPDRASLQSLLGLAAFMRGEESSNSNLLKTSENYFLESLKYDPQMAKNYFYLGSLERDHFENDEEAQKYFKKGCDLKYQPCCDKLKEAASAQSKDESAPQPTPEIAKPAPLPLPTPVSPPQAPVVEVKKTDFGDLPRKDIDTVKRISSLYSKKGLTADQVQQLESGLAQQFKSMRPEDRAKGLEEFIKALTK